MTELLLDTHALLWWYSEPEKAPVDVRDAMNRDDNNIFVSAVTAYEIALKNKIGKLPGVENLLDKFALRLTGDGFHQLPIARVMP